MTDTSGTPEPAERLRKIAQTIRSLQDLRVSLGERVKLGGGLIIDALDCGAFAGSQHVELRRFVLTYSQDHGHGSAWAEMRLQLRRGRELPLGQELGPHQRLEQTFKEDCTIIAGAIEAEVEAIRVKAEQESAAKPQSWRQWTRERTAREVEEYVTQRKQQYNDLVPKCLAGNKDASKKFQSMFGPTAIAKKIGRGCTRQAVSRTAVYKECLQPLFKKPPRTPKAWKPPEVDDSKYGDTIAGMYRAVEESD